MTVAGLRVGRVLGIEVRIHASWLLVLCVIVIVIGGSDLATAYVGWPRALPWIIGGAVALLYLTSIAAHELVHALVARRRGTPVDSIALHAFGGTASSGLPGRTPQDEALVGLAGPVTSLVLAGASAGLAVAVTLAAPTGAAGEAIVAIALFTAVLNGLVGLVNLVPAYPMDGGRVLRAVVWHVTGSERRGSRAAARAGRWIGLATVGAGLAILLLVDPLDGAMVFLTGWILRGTATSALRTSEVEELLDGVRVGDVMETDVASIAPYVTLDVVADQLLDDGSRVSIAVRDNGLLIGLLGISQVRSLRRAAWTVTRVADRMARLASLPVLAADDPVWLGVQELHRTGADGLPVMLDADLLGVLTRTSVSRAVRTRVAARFAGAR